MRDVIFTDGFLDSEFVGESREVFNYDNFLNWSVNVDIGVKRQITENLTFNTFISADALMSRVKRDIPILYQYFNLGLGVGLAYSIN